MLRVGLTGGIGSGKSTVAKIFEVLGIPVYYADETARRIMNEDSELKEQIVKNFGAKAYSNGELDRAYIASIVFQDKEKLDLLNKLVHPATIRDGERWMSKWQKEGIEKIPYVIKEAALIFESGSHEYLDYVIGVSAPQEMRIRRVMQRDHVNRDEILGRMKNQIEEDVKMKRCDFVLRNNEEELLVPQVLELHHKLKLLSASKAVVS